MFQNTKKKNNKPVRQNEQRNEKKERNTDKKVHSNLRKKYVYLGKGALIQLKTFSVHSVCPKSI